MFVFERLDQERFLGGGRGDRCLIWRGEERGCVSRVDGLADSVVELGCGWGGG